MLDIILELILNGAFEAVGSKKVPIVFRIVLALILLTFIYGVCGLLIYVGIETSNIALAVMGILLLVVFTLLIISKVRNHKQKGA